MLKVGVIGASGYTGAELLRILWSHPEFEVTGATAYKYKDQPISSVYPSLAGYYEGYFIEYDKAGLLEDCDVFFIGLPHGEAMKVVPEIECAKKKIVDLSADFRFRNTDVYTKLYGIEHECPGVAEKAVYGLVEANREEISRADVVANPGCYPTAFLMGIMPLVRDGAIEKEIIVDAKSGVSGAGRKLTIETHFPQAADGMVPYAVGNHRHGPEMEIHLEDLSGKSGHRIIFAPHLAPMNRGILCTIYVRLKSAFEPSRVRGIYEAAYGKETFVQILDEGEYPSTKDVQGSNNCQVNVEAVADDGMLVVMVAIDNLVKGASGQAVQNMNLMCGLPEETGLIGPGLFP